MSSPALAWTAADQSAFDPTVETPHPDSLVISIASFQQDQCGFVPPFDSVHDCVDKEQLALTIPPELNRPALIALEDPRIIFAWTFRQADCGGGSGYGSGYLGTMEILSSDASTVTVRLLDTQDAFVGDHVATRCGSVPPPFVPTSAVAVRGSALSTDPSSGTGPVADPDSLYVFLGSTPGSCAEPQPIVDCTENTQMVLRLPPGLQGPGEVALTDPEVDAAYTSPINSCAASAANSGTMTILAASETEMSVRVFGSGWSAMLDGDYDVTICP